ncbi:MULTISPECIES: GtrA family protein [Clostridia]|jgi:putative flippase GtrA|uniref:Sugar translocase n=1 Tax=Lacrimispora celerecrescens TaxID=29354 RepID=A0A084JMA8_9FIRM|nr:MULTISPECIES: GtrA family protein [Clostridia]MBW4846946.1 GtrA family protein [Lachnospiraceae bacterium]CUX59865.1 GtrA-like protein [Clostridium sp. C105KSO15]HBC99792.1 GtrA family protein [Lachnoclostridium sp.]KEZ90092.1 sugar translocase [Lacrimispora celerecrescens]MSS08844.1 GtrA family protein [Clostridium sp. WB02_MRS01]
MIRKIWDKVMNREVISYLIFGVLTTLVNWVVYWFMVKAGIDYRAATAAAWVVSVLFAFIVNKIFVFQSYDLHLSFVMKEILSFTACRAASGVMEMVLMVIMVSWLKMDEYVSKILVSVVVVIANYGFSKAFIFRKRKEEPL